MQNNKIVYAVVGVIALGMFGLLFFKSAGTAATPVTVVPTPASEESVPVEAVPDKATSSPAQPAQTAPTPKPSTPAPQPKPVTAKPATSATVHVTIDNYNFSPPTITVKKGTTVVWVNHDIAKHTITADAGAFTSEFFGKGEQYGHLFADTGTFSYHCEPHPYMKGTVIVTD